MIPFSEYYKNLFEHYDTNTPDYTHNGIEEYYTTAYEQWGGMMWWELLNEGLIQSYPKKNVVNYLNKMGAIDVTYSNNVPFQEEPTNPIIAKFQSLDSTKVEELNKGLLSLGYKISGTINKIVQSGIVTIEPIFPSKYIPIKMDNFYHVTHDKHWNKIQSIGLIPRDTKTVFQHPGSRIYLIQTDSLSIINSLIKQLNIKSPIILKVDIDDIELFEDPMAPSNIGKFKACFTTQNISPDRLTLIKTGI